MSKREQDRNQRRAAFDHGYMEYLSQDMSAGHIEQFSRMLESVDPRWHKAAADGWTKAAKDMVTL